MADSFRALALVAGLIAAAAASPAAAVEGPAQISVSGQASVDAPPDYAQITIGASTTAPVAKDAMAENSKAVADIIALAKSEGVDAKDIRTSSLSIYPLMNANAVTGYRADNTVQIKLRDLDKIGNILDKAVGKGANAISGVSFLLNDPDALLDKARPLAFADARRKAEIYAAAAGVKVGRLLDLTESGGGGPLPHPFAPMAATARAQAVPIEAGENKVTVSVNATFEIAP